jgi:hypothetical protein
MIMKIILIMMTNVITNHDVLNDKENDHDCAVKDHEGGDDYDDDNLDVEDDF